LERKTLTRVTLGQFLKYSRVRCRP
jgi:hypothetical protein